jgi:hypothetical protein
VGGPEDPTAGDEQPKVEAKFRHREFYSISAGASFIFAIIRADNGIYSPGIWE